MNFLKRDNQLAWKNTEQIRQIMRFSIAFLGFSFNLIDTRAE